MRVGEELLRVGFFTEHTPAEERVKHIELLEEEISWMGIRSHIDLLESTKATAAGAAKNLLRQRDPVDSAETSFLLSRSLSENVLNMNGQLSSPIAQGASNEVAIHNFILWGIAQNKHGRYVRLTTDQEDASTRFGKRNGYDIVYRTDNRRWKIQAKSSLFMGNPNKYSDDVIVVSPGLLLRDADVSADDVHSAVVEHDEPTLKSMWQNFTGELRKQKAKNSRGYRQVI